MDGVYVRKFVKKGPDGIIYVKAIRGVIDAFPVITEYPDLQEGEMVSIKNYIDRKTLASFPQVVDPSLGPKPLVPTKLKEAYFKLVNKDLHEKIENLAKLVSSLERDQVDGHAPKENKSGSEEEAESANNNYWRRQYESEAALKIYWTKSSIEWRELYEKELHNTAPKKGRKVSMFKKAAIYLILGALVGNIPFSEVTESTKEFFSGSDTVLTGKYQQVSVCGDCKENFGLLSDTNDVTICGQCGSRNIERKVAADLYRDRTFPMLDKVVGTRFRNDDGTTTIVLDDGDTIIPPEEG